MRNNFLRLIVCGALAAGILGCMEGGDVQIPVPHDLGDLEKMGHKGVDLTLWFGRNVDMVVGAEGLTLACTGCVRDDPPNSVFKPCNPAPCPQSDADYAAFDKGIVIMRAMFDAQKRGEKIEFVIPTKK